MNKSHWEIAALAKTMGMRTTIVLDPNQVTPRVKTSIKKQLRAGVITTSASSQTGKIAAQLIIKFGLPASRDTYRGILIGRVSMDIKRRLRGLVQADRAVALLEDPHMGNHRYHKEKHDILVNQLNNPASANFYVGFKDNTLAMQGRALVVEALTDDDLALIETAIAALEGNEPIHITTYSH